MASGRPIARSGAAPLSERSGSRLSGEPATQDEDSGWRRIDRSAFGVIYGSIMVLSILMASGNAAFETAAVLFGSVLAITLAKAFAETVSQALETGERITRQQWRDAWRHSRVTLTVANLPTLLFVASGFGLLAYGWALLASQILCVGLLATLGARVGWVIDARVVPAVLGAVASGGVGLALAAMKVVIH